MLSRLFAATVATTLSLACMAWPVHGQDKKNPKPKDAAPSTSKDAASPKDSPGKKADTPSKDTPAAPDTAAVKGVRQAHASLLRWLGSGDSANGWKTYLMSDELADQLQRGRKADRQVVKAIAAKYSGNTQGLSLPQFVTVRNALRTWQIELATPTEEELPQAARDAKDDFRPVSEQERRPLKVGRRAAP